MTPAEKERFVLLVDLLVNEKNPAKLKEIVREVNTLLERKLSSRPAERQSQNVPSNPRIGRDTVTEKGAG